MRETKKPVEDSQDVRDETFLLQHSSRPGSTSSLDKVHEELSKLLELARAGTKAIDPTARAFASGQTAGLEEAIKIIDRALQAERAARIKAIVQGRDSPRA